MHEDHKDTAPDRVKCAVITVSDTRNKTNDKSGRWIVEQLTEAGHEVTCYEIVPDEVEIIRATVKQLAKNKDVDAMILNGGTGIASRDVTIEAVQPLFAKEIPGFGELFRLISYQEDIGSASMLSRATCGTVNYRLVFILPGSTGAVKLGIKKLILPEIAHGVGELKKDL